MRQGRTGVTLVQRFIPHYRSAFFENLERLSTYDWSFQAGRHPGQGSGGLATNQFGGSRREISCSWLSSRYCWQSGVLLDATAHSVLVLELTYTILSNPLLVARAKAKGIRCVGWGKGLPEQGAQRPLAKRGFEKLLLSSLDAVIAYGSLSADHFRAQGVRPESIFVAQNSLDTEAIASRRAKAKVAARQLAAKLNLPDGRPVLGYLGRLVEQKRIDAIIQAFEIVRHSGSDAILLIAGAGPDAGRLKNLASSSPWKSDIHLVGEVPESDVDAYFQLFDAYLSFAAGGLGILEAMAHGRCIVSTPEKWPETELLENDTTAVLSTGMDPSSFAEAMRYAVANPTVRSSTGDTAESVVKSRATHSRMVEAFDAAVTTALSTKR